MQLPITQTMAKQAIAALDSSNTTNSTSVTSTNYMHVLDEEEYEELKHYAKQKRPCNLSIAEKMDMLIENGFVCNKHFHLQKKVGK